MKNSEKFLWVIIIIVAIVIVYWGISYRDLIREKDGILSSPSPTPTATPVSKPRVSTPAPTLTYEDALRQYSGTRIQFDNSCQAIPSSFTVTNGTKVMFDNRSSQPKNITVDGKSYSFKAFGFRIINLSSPTLPKTISINCDNRPNVGQILLQ